LEHLVFCERQCALIHLERLWDENKATVEGKNLHERSHDTGTESRGDVRVARGLLLRSLRLGLSGKTDVVEFHLLSDGEPEASGAVLPGVSGRWRPFPVEYKRGRLRHERSYEVQLCAQALCLEEMLSVSVSDGALFYGKTARRQPVTFDEELRRDTEAAAARLHELFRVGVTPKAVFVKNKCRQCSLFERCLPEASDGRGRAGRYLARVITQEHEP
jgi:CRISPR-associated exonuclease Cas4